MYCLIIGKLILLCPLIVLRNSSCQLDVELVVSTPIISVIVTSYIMCGRSLIILVESRYKINMICMPLKNIKII